MEKFQNLIKECILKNYSKVFLEENYKATIFDIHANIIENHEVEDIFSKKDIEDFLSLFVNEGIETSDSKKIIDWDIPNFGTIKIIITNTEEKLYLTLYLPIGYDLFISEISDINEEVLKVDSSSFLQTSIPDLTDTLTKKKILESSFASISKNHSLHQQDSENPLIIDNPFNKKIDDSIKEDNSKIILPPPPSPSAILESKPTSMPIPDIVTTPAENEGINLENKEESKSEQKDEIKELNEQSLSIEESKEQDKKTLSIDEIKTLKLFETTSDSVVCYLKVNDIARFKIKSDLKKLGTFVDKKEFNDIKEIFSHCNIIKSEVFSNYYQCFYLSNDEVIIKKIITDEYFQERENKELSSLMYNKSGLIISLDTQEYIDSSDFITNFINSNFEKYILKLENHKKVQHSNKKSIVHQNTLSNYSLENISSIINKIEPNVIILDVGFLTKDNINFILNLSNHYLTIIQTNYINRSELISSLKFLLEDISSIRVILDRTLKGIVKLNKIKYEVEPYSNN